MSTRTRTRKKVKPQGYKPQEIVIPSIPKQTIAFGLRGLSPLLFNRFHPDDQDALEASQIGKARKPSKRDPDAEVERTLWRIDKNRFGYATRNLVAAFIGGIRKVKGITMTSMKGAIQITNYEPCLDEPSCSVVPLITSEKPKRHRRSVGGTRGAKTVKYSGILTNWGMEICASFPTGDITQEQFLQAWQLAGEFVGIGGYRPACSGDFGRFEVVNVVDLKDL